MKFAEIIENAKEKQGGISQNKLAEMLGMTSSGLSKIVRGGAASERTLVKIARLSESSLEEVTFAYNADRATTIEGKAMWKKLMASAASFLVAAPLVSSIAREVCILC